MTGRRRKTTTSLVTESVCAAMMMLLVVAGSSLGDDRAGLGQTQPAAQTEIEGEFQVVHQDFKHSGRYIYYLKTTQGLVPLHFGKRPPTNLLSGTHVRVRGAQQPDGSLMLTSGSTSIKSTSTAGASTGPLPNTLGAQSTLVLLVNFEDDPANQPYTAANAQSVVFGTANAFFLENSYQQTWLTGDVAGWYTIPLSSTNCDTSSIESYAQAAAASAGVNLSAYSHFVYAFPQNSACGWAGSSYIGGNPSQSWINGINSATG